MDTIETIDWHSNPQATAVDTLAVIFTIVGGLFVVVSLTTDDGLYLLIPSVVVLAIGMIGWFVKLGLTWWQRESRNQMLALTAAITREEQL